MSAVYMTVNGPERDLNQLGIDCEAEIVERILRGEWAGFFEESHDDLEWIVRDTLREATSRFDAPADSDVAIGLLRREIEKLAKLYASEYVEHSNRDPEDLAIDLGILEIAE